MRKTAFITPIFQKKKNSIIIIIIIRITKKTTLGRGLSPNSNNLPLQG